MTEEQSLVDDLAEVLVRMTIGWEDVIGADLAQHPAVVRVMARYRQERDETHDVVVATRQMANAANAAIREVVLAALGEEDDGKTPLIDQVRRLAARVNKDATS